MISSQSEHAGQPRWRADRIGSLSSAAESPTSPDEAEQTGRHAAQAVCSSIRALLMVEPIHVELQQTGEDTR